MFMYCKTFFCSPAEYEARPYAETTWMLEIDRVHRKARSSG